MPPSDLNTGLKERKLLGDLHGASPFQVSACQPFSFLGYRPVAEWFVYWVCFAVKKSDLRRLV